jgi:hypothetical protein
MFFPTQDALKRAHAVQLSTIADDAKGDVGRTPDEAYVAAVHTRQDMTLLCGLVLAQHSQLVNISRGVWALVVIAFLFAVKLFG